MPTILCPHFDLHKSIVVGGVDSLACDPQVRGVHRSRENDVIPLHTSRVFTVCSFPVFQYGLNQITNQ